MVGAFAGVGFEGGLVSAGSAVAVGVAADCGLLRAGGFLTGVPALARPHFQLRIAGRSSLFLSLSLFSCCPSLLEVEVEPHFFEGRSCIRMRIIRKRPPPPTPRKHRIAKPGYPKRRNGVSTRINKAAPTINAAKTNPRVMRLAIF